tara:strand:- start:1799 stop:2422 length:624 start_codon:yes stop_codon:yes gene_type:complete
MILKGFKSEPPLSPFAPVYFHQWCEELIKGIDYKKIAKIILKKEPELMKQYGPTQKPNQDGYTGLGKDSLTSRYDSYDIFKVDPSIEALIPKIQKVHDKFLKALNLKAPPKIRIKGWANVLRKGESIHPHLHDISSSAYLAGNIPIQCQDTSTFYMNPLNQLNDPEVYETKNKIGLLTLFPSTLPHYTNKHMSSEERITIAFGLKLL